MKDSKQNYSKHNNRSKRYLAFGVAAAAVLALSACGESGEGGGTASGSAADSAQSRKVKSYTEFAGIEAKPDSEDVKTVVIAYGYAAYPIAYTTDEGEASGYDIEMLKAVDALLPDYRFEFTASQGGDDLLLGVQTGKFDGAVRNWFQTAERREIFTFPEKNVGLSVTGLTVRTAELDKIYDFASLSAAGGLLVPVDPGDGHYTVLKNWCDANPDKAWAFETGSLTSQTDAYAWVAEGRYDAYFSLEVGFQRNVSEEDGPAHKYADTLSWTPCAAIPTYVIFSLEDKDVAAAFDSVIDEVWDSGYADYLQETLYGVDYIAEYGRDGLGFQGAR